MAVVNHRSGSDLLAFGWRCYLEGKFDRMFEVDVHYDIMRSFYVIRVKVFKAVDDVLYVTEVVDDIRIVKEGWTEIFPSKITLTTIMLLLG